MIFFFSCPELITIKSIVFNDVASIIKLIKTETGNSL